MARLLVPRSLVARIEQHGLGKEFRAFALAITNGTHPPRIYKASGVSPNFQPYQDLRLHHHHLHRDGDPLLVTQHIENEVHGVALATHATYFHGDQLAWLKQHMDAIDWVECPGHQRTVAAYDDFADDGPD